MKHRLLRPVIALLFVISLLPAAAPAAAAYSDTAGSWASQTIEKWTALGIVQGYDDRFRPDDPITRGEAAVILDRIMKYQDAGQNSFADLKQAFYTDALLKSVAAGTIPVSDTLARPVDAITREETAVLLARALGIEDSVSGAAFLDNQDISPSALGCINTMAARGILRGCNGRFDPKADMTRAGFITLLDRAVALLCSEVKEYSGMFEGTVIVNTPGAVLKNMTVYGDLLISEGAGDGDVTLTNVRVTGNTVVRGGGADSVHIDGGSVIPRLVVCKSDDGQLRIVSSGASVSAVDVIGGHDDIILTGSFGTVAVSAQVSVDLVDATVGTVTVSAARAVLFLNNSASLDLLKVVGATVGVYVDNRGRIGKAELTGSVVIDGNQPLN